MLASISTSVTSANSLQMPSSSLRDVIPLLSSIQSALPYNIRFHKLTASIIGCDIVMFCPTMLFNWLYPNILPITPFIQKATFSNITNPQRSGLSCPAQSCIPLRPVSRYPKTHHPNVHPTPSPCPIPHQIKP